MPSRKSAKPQVIEAVFFDRWDEKTKPLSNPVVTMADLSNVIERDQVELSTDNLANFFKDIVRNRTRNQNFPASVLEKGYTGTQAAGRGMKAVFEFIPLPDGQEAAFADFEPDPAKVDGAITVQSLSLPLAARRLGRQDESWLAQATAHLSIIELHLARFSKHQLVSVDHLMTNMKLGRGEVDSIWRGELEIGDEETQTVLIPAEMKSLSEVLELEQVKRGAEAMAEEGRRKLRLDEAAPVISMAVKVHATGLIWVIEFEMDFEDELTLASDAVYQPRPRVSGI